MNRQEGALGLEKCSQNCRNLKRGGKGYKEFRTLGEKIPLPTLGNEFDLLCS